LEILLGFCAHILLLAQKFDAYKSVDFFPNGVDTMANEITTCSSSRIEIPGDVLIPDEEFCDEVLGGACTKTASRYEALGLPFAFIAGRKWRPVVEGGKWVAARIQRRGQQPTKRAARGG
jgi:hypothetical protein